MLTRVATSAVQRIRSEIQKAPLQSMASQLHFLNIYLYQSVLGNLFHLSKNRHFAHFFTLSHTATKRVEEEKSLGRWSDHDEEGGAEEPDSVDDSDNTSLEVTTTHFTLGRVTPPAGPSSRRANNNNIQSPTQNKMSIIRSSGSIAQTAVRPQSYYLVAIIYFFSLIVTLL